MLRPACWCGGCVASQAIPHRRASRSRNPPVPSATTAPASHVVFPSASRPASAVCARRNRLRVLSQRAARPHSTRPHRRATALRRWGSRQRVRRMPRCMPHRGGCLAAHRSWPVFPCSSLCPRFLSTPMLGKGFVSTSLAVLLSAPRAPGVGAI